MKIFLCVILIMVSCFCVNNNFFYTENLEDTAIKVSLSFANLKKDNNTVDFISPVENPIIVRKFGKEDLDFHIGADIASITHINVFSVADGEVVETGYDDYYGNYIKILHKSGYQSFYAHLAKVFEKEQVLKGDIIGEIGNTGDTLSYHLHLEITLDDENINPQEVINFYEN